MKSSLLFLSIICSLNALAQTPWIAFRSHGGHEAGFFNAKMEDNLGLPSNYSQRQFENIKPIESTDTAYLNSIKKDSLELKKQEDLQKKMKAEDVKANAVPVHNSGGPSESKHDGKKSKKKRIKKSTSSATKVLNHTTINHQKDLKQNGFSIGVIITGGLLLLMGIVIRTIKSAK